MDKDVLLCVTRAHSAAALRIKTGCQRGTFLAVHHADTYALSIHPPLFLWGVLLKQ